MHILKDKALRKEFISFTIPFLIQELIINLTGLLTSFIVNPQVGEEVRNGIFAAGRIYFLLSMTIGAVVFVGNLFISQHFGKGKMDSVKKDFHLALKLAFIINLLFFLVCMIIPKQLITLFIPGQELAIELGAKYMRVFAISFPFTGLSLIYYCLMKCSGLERYASLNSIITLGVMLVTTTIFVFATPNMIEGIALATVITRFIELVINVVIVQIKGNVKFSFKDFISPNTKLFKRFIRHGGPLTIAKLSWAFAFIMISVILGQLHNPYISDANGLLSNVLGIIMCIPNAITATLSVSIGRRLGANKLEDAKETGQQILKLNGVLAVITMCLFLLGCPIVIGIHSATTPLKEETLGYLWKFFLITSVTFVPRCYNGPIMNGILNAGGDTLYVSIVDSIAGWVSTVLLGFLGVHFNWHPLAIYSCLQLDEIVKFPVNLWRYKKGIWIRNIVKKDVDEDVAIEQ